MGNNMAKFMCSYGGEIQRDTQDHKISYVGGHTKILSVGRGIKFPAMLAELSRLCNAAGDVFFKYQLPGLDDLISVTNDNDFDNMMLEYDQLPRASAAPARMRLFLFPNSNPRSGPVSAQPDPVQPNSSAVVPPPSADPAPPRVAESTSDRVVVSDPNVNNPLEVQRQLQLLACSSSSCTLVRPLTPGPGKYDVFISFRGEDTRTNFTCHLHEALCRKRLKIFIDYELHKGNEISPSLFGAIEGSYVSVVVFSENYASSKWCLEELVKILECRKEHGQVVIPVFYHIDPSLVRKQDGSYKKAFEEHLKNPMRDTSKVQSWKNALAEAAALAGWDSQSRSYRDDTELIQKIVKDVLQKLIYHYPPNDFRGLVGIDKNSAPLESLLGEARSVGVWGIGGIGKTTIARFIFDKYSRQYEGSCFLENVRERSGDHGQWLHDLRDKLYSELLNEKIRQNSTAKSTLLERRIHRQRNFIVLDDVSSPEQLEYLVGKLQSYGPDSKIIITTRDKSVLEKSTVERIHEVGGLDFHESLTLFSLRAFNEDSPEVRYKELSDRAVAYCKGVPLALVVLGSVLRTIGEAEWGSALNKLEKIPNKDIQNVLKLSYDGLDYEEQQIFLDIAYFFKGEPKENVVNLLDSCGLFAVYGMRSLLNKALITVSNDSVGMHDLIQQMGWQISRQESIENPGNRSRLLDFDDTWDVLENNKGTDKIRGIMLDMSQSRQILCLSDDTFQKMPNLRYLKFVLSRRIPPRLCGLQLRRGTVSFPGTLRYLEWHACPLQSLPSKFSPEKLVTLRMPHSQLKRLWSGVQNLVNLKEVDLSECLELMELPDFSTARKLKSVQLFFCKSLRHVHPSILSLDELECLDVRCCSKLETLESKIHLRSLRELEVSCCPSLKKISLSLEAVASLWVAAAVSVSHLSIGDRCKVSELNVSGSRLENIPEEWSRLECLDSLELSCYRRVISKQTLHVIFDGLRSLRRLVLQLCYGLFELPDNIHHLSSLRVLNLDGSYVERLPENIKHLSRLEQLSVWDCKRLQSLPELPSSIINLRAINCPLFQTVASSSTNPTPQEQKRKSISFEDGVNFDVEKRIDSFHLCIRKLAEAYASRSNGGRASLWDDESLGDDEIQWYVEFRIRWPGHRVPEWFTRQTKGASITFELDQPLDNYSSFLLCVVVSPRALHLPDRAYLRCRYECHLEDGTRSAGEHFLFNSIEEDDWTRWPRCVDHVYMFSDKGVILERIREHRVNQSSITKRRRVNNQSTLYCCYPKITLEFCGVARGVNGDIYFDEFIKGCGVYPFSIPNMRLELEGPQPSSKKLKQSC